MSMENIIVGIDLGSTTIRVAVGQYSVSEDSKIPKLNIIAAVESPSEGVNRGVVTNIEDAGKAIAAAIDKTEQVIGMPISSAWITISGSHITTQLAKGIVAVSKQDGQITDQDVARAIEAAKTVMTPPNTEILHILPRSFQVDNQTNIKNPVGMTGMRLEVDAYMVVGMSSQITNLTKAIWITGLEIEDLVFNPLAASEAVLTSKQKDLGVVVISIGSATTTLAVFEEGDLKLTSILPIGSEHITSDLAICLRTSINTAEAIKNNYGVAQSTLIDKNEEVSLGEFDPTEDVSIGRKYVAEIIEARVEEIFEKVNAELKTIQRQGKLPGGAILCGGGAKLPGIIEVAKDVLKLPASLKKKKKISTIIDNAGDISFSSAIGLILWADQVANKGMSGSKFKTISNVTDKMRGWFKSLMP